MPNVTIDELTPITSPANTQQIELDDGLGGSKKATLGNIPISTGKLSDCTSAGLAMIAAASAAAQRTLLSINAVGAQIAALATIAAGSMLYASSANTIAELPAGTNGYTLQMVAGLPAWVSVPPTAPGGANTQVQFNDGGAFGGDAGMVYDKTTDTLTLLGDIATSKLSFTATAMTSTVQGRFPASTSGASGYASIRLPHGPAPTTNIANGDIWTTSGYGVFARIDGATVGPFLASGDLQLLPNGSATSPSLAFANNSNLGVYRVSGGAMGLASGGALVCQVDGNGITVTGRIFNGNGSVASPAFRFATDEGMYRESSGIIGFATGGAKRMDVSTGQVNVRTALRVFGPIVDYTPSSILFEQRSAAVAYISAWGSSAVTPGYLKMGVYSNDGYYAGAGITLDGYSTLINNGGVKIDQTLTYDNSPALDIVPGAQNSYAVTAELHAVKVRAATQMFYSGTPLTQNRYVFIDAPTYNGQGAFTIATAATFAVAGPPIAGTDMTLTDKYAVWIQSGISVFGAATIAAASIRIPSGTAPTTPVDGDIWQDGTDIKIRIGGTTKTFTLT